MANAYQTYNEYVKMISSEIVNNFGGSYQMTDELGMVWRKKFQYHPKIESFILIKTKVFMRTLNNDNMRDLNFVFNLCNKIADYLSVYMVKESRQLTRDVIKEQLMNKLFFEFDLIANTFTKRYKKPIDLSNSGWVSANPGVVAFYQHKLNKSMQYAQALKGQSIIKKSIKTF